MTTTAIELFACEPHRVRLTTKACAANWKMVNGGTKTTMPGTAMHGNGSQTSRAYGRLACVDCEVGAAHARGEVVPVERLVWKQPAKAAPPPPAPVTVVPRVHGVLDDKTASGSSKPRPLSIEELRQRRAARAPTRNDHPEEKTTMPPKSEEERAAIVAAALDQKLSIDMHAKRSGVAASSLVKWLREVGHNPLDWPTTSQANAAALARSWAAIEEEDARAPKLVARVPAEVPRPHLGIDLAGGTDESVEVVHTTPPRIMDRTELADDDEPALGDVVHEPEPVLKESAPAPEAPTPFFNDISPDDIDATPDADEPIPYALPTSRPRRDEVAELLPVAHVVPVRIAEMIGNLDVSASVAHAVHCIYMAGLALGHSHGSATAVNQAVEWTDRAEAAVRHANIKASSLRGAA